jgi:hypothetical protein
VLAKAEIMKTAAEKAKRAGRRLERIVVMGRTGVGSRRLYTDRTKYRVRRLCQRADMECREYCSQLSGLSLSIIWNTRSSGAELQCKCGAEMVINGIYWGVSFGLTICKISLYWIYIYEVFLIWFIFVFEWWEIYILNFIDSKFSCYS